MSRLLITGGSSYLGQHLVPKALNRHRCLYTFFTLDPLRLPAGARLDIRDREAADDLVQSWKPDAIIHTAGSNRSEDMEVVILRGAENIARAASQVGARLIHISTDVIFDGLKAPYREEDNPTPVHAYGSAKAAAEEIISSHPDHVIIRTSLIYGLDIMDASTQWIVAAMKAGETVTLFTDQVRNPIWAETLSAACIELCHSSYIGILNVAGRQVLSRAELGLKMLDWWGVRGRDNLRIGESTGNWPVDCRLDLSRALYRPVEQAWSYLQVLLVYLAEMDGNEI